jgi:hypothetical protein
MYCIPRHPLRTADPTANVFDNYAALFHNRYHAALAIRHI